MGESTSRYTQLPDGRVLDAAPMKKDKPPMVFDKGEWATFKGTVGEWRDSKPLTDSEANALTVSRPDRLTPSEIESLRQDKRDSSKRLREITKAQAASKH